MKSHQVPNKKLFLVNLTLGPANKQECKTSVVRVGSFEKSSRQYKSRQHGSRIMKMKEIAIKIKEIRASKSGLIQQLNHEFCAHVKLSEMSAFSRFISH